MHILVARFGALGPREGTRALQTYTAARADEDVADGFWHRALSTDSALGSLFAEAYPRRAIWGARAARTDSSAETYTVDRTDEDVTDGFWRRARSTESVLGSLFAGGLSSSRDLGRSGRATGNCAGRSQVTCFFVLGCETSNRNVSGCSNDGFLQ